MVSHKHTSQATENLENGLKYGCYVLSAALTTDCCSRVCFEVLVTSHGKHGHTGTAPMQSRKCGAENAACWPAEVWQAHDSRVYCPLMWPRWWGSRHGWDAECQCSDAECLWNFVRDELGSVSRCPVTMPWPMNPEVNQKQVCSDTVLCCSFQHVWRWFLNMTVK